MPRKSFFEILAEPPLTGVRIAKLARHVNGNNETNVQQFEIFCIFLWRETLPFL
jgi:hypothetical protein